MCWITNNNECTFKKIAEEDIKVFKILAADNTPYYRGGKPYKTGKICPIVTMVTKQLFPYRLAVFSGYHSYSKEKCYLDENGSGKHRGRYVRRTLDGLPVSSYDNNSRGGKLADFIIPKGTAYYENEYGEFVSATIKMI